MSRTCSLAMALFLSVAVVPISAIGQTKDQADELFKEAMGLQQRDQSRDDLEKAAEKFKKALEIYRRTGPQEGIAGAAQRVGQVYTRWGRNPEAIEHFQEALGIYRKRGKSKDEAMVLCDLGDVYFACSKYDKALESYEEALNIARKVRDSAGEARVLNNMGLVYHEWSQNPKAIECYEKSLAIKKRTNDLRGQGQSLNNLALVYKDWGQYDRAVKYHQEDLAICRQFGDTLCQGTGLNNLGIVYWEWGQYVKAAENFHKAQKIFKQFGDERHEGATVNNLGRLYADWGQYYKAVEYCETALTIRKRVGDTRGEGLTLNNLGNVYLAWGQYDRAIQCYEKSLEIKRQLREVMGEGEILNYLGLVYSEWGQYDKAAEYYEKALAIRKQVGDAKGEGTTLISIGTLHAQQGEFNKALKEFEQGLAIYERMRIPTEKPKDLIGNTYLDMGDLERAEPFIRQANFDSSLGRRHFLKGDYSTACSHYENLLRSAESNRDASNLFVACTGLGMAYERLGEDTKAAENFSKAIEQTEEVRLSLPANQRARFFDVKVGGFLRIEPYEGLVRVLMRMNRTVDALKHSEYTKARIFSEALSRRYGGASGNAPVDVVKKDFELNEQLAALIKKRQSAYEKGIPQIIAAVEPQIKEMRSLLAGHIDMLRKQYPLFAATKYPQPMDLDQTCLTPEDWALVYEVTDTGLCIWLLNGKTVIKSAFKPVGREELNRLVRSFRKPMELATLTKENLLGLKNEMTTGKKLFDLLVGEFIDAIPAGKAVVIVPDEVLGVLPFEMLVMKHTGKWNEKVVLPYPQEVSYLGDRNPIYYYQSLTALTLARSLGRAKRIGKGMLVMADPVFGPDDDRVKQTGDEPLKEMPSATTVKLMSIVKETGVQFTRLKLTGALGESLKRLDPKATDLYLGLDACKSRLFHSPLDQYGALVFATHGHFGESIPGIQEPILVLTLVGQPADGDGFLRMSEVMALNLNADVVALTACRTGLGQEVKGEGTMGMGRAFQYAGSKAVLMSLWSVAEASTTEMADRFFSYVKKGKSKLDALQLARKDLRAEGYEHPFFWAGFILIGEVQGEPPEESPDSTR